MQTNTKTDISKLLMLPAIRDAMAAQLASEEGNAAEARQTVLDQLEVIEADLAQLQKSDVENTADIEALRHQLCELMDKGQDINRRISRAKGSIAVFDRELDKQHGGDIINVVSMQLHAVEARLRDEATKLLANQKRGETRFGDVFLKPCPESQAKAKTATDKADLIEQARKGIDALHRERVSPQEIRRRINAALSGIGVKMVDSQVDNSGWQTPTWHPAKQTA